MLTFVFTQLFLVSISLSFNTLTIYHYPNAVAQIAMLFYNLYPYIRIRYLASGLLGLAAVCSGLAWVISAIRTWRYIFFPTKEGAGFFGECLTNVIVVLIQAILMVTQAKSLMQKKKVKFLKSVYTTCVYILFFHDFVYAGLFTYTEDATRIFGYTQFVVHTLMIGLNTKNIDLFQYVWVALLAQHVYVLVMYDNPYIMIFTGVYVIADLIYLINSSLQHQTSIVTRSIKQILGPEESRDE